MDRSKHHFEGRAKRRVVITGIGVIAPNGRSVEAFWSSVHSGKSGACLLTRFDPANGPCRLAAEIPDFNPSDYFDAKVARHMDRSTQYGMVAAKMAALDAGIDFSKIDPDRTGVVEGTSLSNQESLDQGRKAYDSRGPRGVTPTLVSRAYLGSGSTEIATALGCKGHAITCSSGSASGNDVVGYGKTMIENEEVDVMLAGGSEAPLFDTGYAGFSHLRAMTRWSGPPCEAMKPFDRDSDGFLLGEGAAYMVLEELGHALSRGAKIYAEVLGHGRSCEAFHQMAPQPDGVGVVRALEKAFRNFGGSPELTDYINAHGTANAVNDIAESRAIKTFFGARARRISVSSTKPVTGHLLAAAGALEAVICALALKHQIIPPTINLRNPRPECDLDYVPLRSREYPIRLAVNLSSGFGGKTSCMLLGRYGA